MDHLAPRLKVVNSLHGLGTPDKRAQARSRQVLQDINCSNNNESNVHNDVYDSIILRGPCTLLDLILLRAEQV